MKSNTSFCQLSPSHQPSNNKMFPPTPQNYHNWALTCTFCGCYTVEILLCCSRYACKECRCKRCSKEREIKPCVFCGEQFDIPETLSPSVLNSKIQETEGKGIPYESNTNQLAVLLPHIPIEAPEGGFDEVDFAVFEDPMDDIEILQIFGLLDEEMDGINLDLQLDQELQIDLAQDWISQLNEDFGLPLNQIMNDVLDETL